MITSIKLNQQQNNSLREVTAANETKLKNEPNLFEDLQPEIFDKILGHLPEMKSIKNLALSSRKNRDFVQKSNIIQYQNQFKKFFMQLDPKTYKDGQISQWFNSGNFPEVYKTKILALKFLSNLTVNRKIRVGKKDLICLFLVLNKGLFPQVLIDKKIKLTSAFMKIEALKKEEIPQNLQPYVDGKLTEYLMGHNSDEQLFLQALYASSLFKTIIINIPIKLGKKDFATVCKLFTNSLILHLQVADEVTSEDLNHLGQLKMLKNLRIDGGSFSEISGKIFKNLKLKELSLINGQCPTIRIDLTLCSSQLEELELDNMKRVIFTEQSSFLNLKNFFLKNSSSSLADFPFLEKENQLQTMIILDCLSFAKMPIRMSYQQLERLQLRNLSISLESFDKFSGKTSHIERYVIEDVQDSNHDNVNIDDNVKQSLKKNNFFICSD